MDPAGIGKVRAGTVRGDSEPDCEGHMPAGANKLADPVLSQLFVFTWATY